MIRPADLFARANTAAGRVIVLALVGAATGAGMRLAGSRQVAALTAAGIALLGLLRWWPGSAVALLLASAALDRFTYSVGGAAVKPEHVATLLVAGVLILRWAQARGAMQPAGQVAAATRPAASRTEMLADHLASGGLLIYLGLNLFSSLVNAPQPADSVRLTGLVTLVSVPYFLMPLLVRDARLVRRAVGGWLVLCALEAAFGITIMVLYQQGIDLGVQITLGSPPVPVGTLREGNIFGSYTAAGAVACGVWLLSSRRARVLGLATLGATLTLGGVIVSLSRGAWLGLAGGGLLVLALQARAAARRGLGLGLLVLVLLPLLLAFAGTPFLDEAGTYITGRLTTLNPDTILNDGTVAERLDTYAKALDGIGVHPWIGNGTGSFGQRYVYRSINAPAWVGNLELHVLYDTGILGLLAFLGCLGATGWAAVRAYRRSTDPEWRALLLALGAALVVLLIAYQATEATWLAFTWVHLGLLRAATRVRSAECGSPQGSPCGVRNREETP